MQKIAVVYFPSIDLDEINSFKKNMKISVKAKPKSKSEYVKRIGELSFVVAVTEAPEKGKANQAIIKALANFLGIKPSLVILISGQTSRQKIFEVPDLGQMKLL